jgi:Fic family protein
MDLSMFVNDHTGSLVHISGNDPRAGDWHHAAFVPAPLPATMPQFSDKTFLAVSAARAALAALDSTARQLPDPTMLRTPALRREAQSTSALEGTYAPLASVFTADEDEPASTELVEILNYVRMADHGFSWIADGRPITVAMLEHLQGQLMRSTPLERHSGAVRNTQVVIGRRADADEHLAPVHAARFIPPPPGDHLSTGLQDLVRWLQTDHSQTIDPIVAAAMSHYQFETLHPFHDGNGRLGRLMIVLHLLQMGVLGEPTLTVSPWFEARRSDYYTRLLAVSTDGNWDDFVRFFAAGLREAADNTHRQMLKLVAVQNDLKEIIRASPLRADSAHALVDFAVANPSFSVRKVEADLGISYGRANKLVGQLVDLGVLDVIDPDAYKRRFFAPRVLDVLTEGS